MHKCENCVVACMDFRIQETLAKLREELGIEYGSYDMVTIPGGAGNLGQLIEDLHLSTGLHDAKSLVLTAHEDCGAGKTKEDLIQAITDAKKIFSDKNIEGYFIFLNGTWEKVN